MAAPSTSPGGDRRPPVAVIGFGEAGAALFGGGAASVQAYDRKTDDSATAEAKRADYAAAGVQGCSSAGEALAGVAAVACLVTADQAFTAAQTCAAHVSAGALWLDMNSVSPAAKRRSADVIEAVGGRYVDVAVMAPVHPARRDVPLLLSGPDASAAVQLLSDLGFSDMRVVEGGVGAASAIKMIRSVMVKGIEALSAECFLAARVAGVLEEVVATLNATSASADWNTRAAYNLERMTTHGLRRAAEMEEVVATLEELKVGGVMSRGAVTRHRRLGELGLDLKETHDLSGRLDRLLERLIPAQERGVA